MKSPMALAAIVGVALLAASGAAKSDTPSPAQERRPDVIWIPTEDPVVTAMLKMANVTKDDVVYDLGCGDGRIVIAAARLGARGVGVDIDPARISDANAAAAKAGVSSRVTFILGDIFDPALKIGDATVVMLYLLQSLNERLRPRLQAELQPGTRIVSNAFTMGSAWPAERSQQVGDSVIYRWTIGK